MKRYKDIPVTVDGLSKEALKETELPSSMLSLFGKEVNTGALEDSSGTEHN